MADDCKARSRNRDMLFLIGGILRDIVDMRTEVSTWDAPDVAEDFNSSLACLERAAERLVSAIRLETTEH